MGYGQIIIDAIQRRQAKKNLNLAGPIGDFYRGGGNELLYDLPANTSSLIIDGGGYEGEWTAQMLAKYGCRSVVFEPIPHFAKQLRNAFGKNGLVVVHECALGKHNHTASFSLNQDGSSEFSSVNNAGVLVKVIDFSEYLKTIADPTIACLKLNIEGGEYDVIERLIECDETTRFDSFLIQFHRQPANYQARYRYIESELCKTHVREWCYSMVWEKWTIKSDRP